MNIKLKNYFLSFYINFIYILTFLIYGFFINIIQCFIYVSIKPFSPYLFQKINYYCCWSFYAQLNFWTEWYGKGEVVLYADKDDYEKYIGKEHALIVSNHLYEIDWLFIGLLSEKLCLSGNYKSYIKKSLRYVPAIGWCLGLSDNIFLDRNFEKDKPVIKKQISVLASYTDPIWLILYPEGTRYTPEKHKTSLQIAKEKGLPELKHLLLPRVKGFETSVEFMRNKIPAIYDLTITFDPDEDMKPTTQNLLKAGKMRAHICIQRIPLDNVPMNETKVQEILYNMYAKKDKLLDSFYKTGDFFKESGIKEMHRFTFSRKYGILINTLILQFIIMGTIFYYLTRFLMSSNIIITILVIALILIGSYLMSRSMSSLSETKYASKYGTSKSN